MKSVDWDDYVDFQRIKIYFGVYDILVSTLNLKMRCSNSAALLPRFLLRIRSVRILNTIVCSETLVIEPTDLGATTELLIPALCLSIFN